MTAAFPAAANRYTVAVRALCEFTAKQGDLDLRFTPSPSAREGVEGHALVASRRGEGWQAEFALSADHGDLLRVQGRADLCHPEGRRIEEVKTFRGELAGIPENHRRLHWAQLKVYGWMMCLRHGFDAIELALVYFQVDTHQETVLPARFDAAELRAHFESQCERFVAWAEQEAGHRASRDVALQGLRFPHADFRTGQRELAESVYRAASSARCLVMQAPTGIGKTVGTLFPLLKACPAQRIDKVFCLSAKTSGRRLTLDGLQHIARASGPPLRVLELVAREKACEHPDKACHGDSCPLAKGFYDRLPAARGAAAGHLGPWDQTALRTIAASHGVCPYYLSQELVRWCDVAVGDYNHYFGLHAMLHGLTRAHQWRVGVLVDEAHNLLERARAMHTAELDPARMILARRHAPPDLKKSLDRLRRSWSALCAGDDAPYRADNALPAGFIAALQRTSAALSDHQDAQTVPLHSDLLAFHFEALRFLRLGETFDTHSMFDLTRLPARKGRPQPARLCIRNILPAPFLRPRFAAAHSVTLFSATLTPWGFHSETLGLPDNAAFVDVASPFDAAQLSVHVARHISTRYRHREASLEPIVALMASQWRERPGNYLAFFSSFDYLVQVADRFEALHPDIPAWRQSRGMSESAQREFTDRFGEDTRGIGFAVLGGSFSEGIDLPGRRLIGAFIATLGLPQVNPVNEQMRQRLDQLLGQGERYTYLYPGLQKVVQAAGRVIRTPSDQGVLHLMDDRFLRAEVQGLLPPWWRLRG